MKKTTKHHRASEMRKEYDFSRGQRGKYAKRYAAGNNVVVLAPDLVKAFPTSESVNDALHKLLEVARRSA